MTQQTPNPVISTTVSLNGVWLVREYRNGMWDMRQFNGTGLTPGFESWDDLMDWCKEEGIFTHSDVYVMRRERRGYTRGHGGR